MSEPLTGSVREIAISGYTGKCGAIAIPAEAIQFSELFDFTERNLGECCVYYYS